MDYTKYLNPEPLEDAGKWVFLSFAEIAKRKQELPNASKSELAYALGRWAKGECKGGLTGHTRLADGGIEVRAE